MPLERVLMVVKTYPSPSRQYGELTLDTPTPWGCECPKQVLAKDQAQG